MLRFIHAADFHLDSAFAALTPRQAAARRRESRELPVRLANYVNQNNIDLVLLAGDLFDSAASYRDTAEELSAALGQMEAQVYIAPGNHDWYGPGSPYLTVKWPENVHIFTQPRLETMEWPEKNLVLHGAAFTHGEQADGFLTGFTAPADGKLHIGLLHGEIDPSEARYDPIRKEEIAASGLAYLALGHIHKRTEPLTCGRTVCAWPGCPEGRGFDETGDKGVYLGQLEGGRVSLDFVPLARRRYLTPSLDITGQDPAQALEALIRASRPEDILRISLTGTRDPDNEPNLTALTALASGYFYSASLYDNTTLSQALWARMEEDTLTGLFLRAMAQRLQEAAPSERPLLERAVRFGLAALEGREEPQ